MATLVPSSDPGSNDPIGALPTTPSPAPPPASAPAPEVASAPIATTLTPPPPAPILGGNSSAGLVEKKPSLWSSILMGALWGLAGSAGQKHFGGGVAAGAAGAFEGQAQQQQLKFESLRAADSHVRALNEARAADTKDAAEKQATADHKAEVADMNGKLGLPGPTGQISGTTSDEMHTQANGMLGSLASSNGGKIPPVIITQSPATPDKESHDIDVYAPPTSAQLQKDPDAWRKFTNANLAMQGITPRSDQDWKTGDGSIVPDPSHPIQTIAAQAAWQAKQVADAQHNIYGVPKLTGNVGRDKGMLENLKYDLARYKASPNADPNVARVLESRNNQFKASLQPEIKQKADDDAEAIKKAGAQETAVQLAEQATPAGKAKLEKDKVQAALARQQLIQLNQSNDIAAIPKTVSGDAYVAQVAKIDPGYAAELTNIYNGKEPLTRLDYLVARGGKVGQRDIFSDLNQAYGDKINLAGMKGFVQTYQDFDTGKTAKEIVNLNNAVDHAQQLSEALGKVGMAGKIALATGATKPAAYYGVGGIKELQTTAGRLSDEIQMAYGSGHTNEQVEQTLSALKGGNVGSIRNGLQTSVSLLADLANNTASQWLSAAPSKAWQPPRPILGPDQEKIMNTMAPGRWKGNPGQPAQNNPPPAPAPPPGASHAVIVGGKIVGYN